MGNKISIEGLLQLKKKDIGRCADIAARAFLNDPSSVYLLKDKLSYKALYDFYIILYKSLFNKMNIFVDSEKIDGFLIVSTIKNSVVTVWDFIKNGGLKIILRHGFGLVKRSLEFENNNILIRQKFIEDSSWYIMQFGVSPEKQGSGIGSSVIKPFLNWLDKNKLSCYLETLKTVNVSMYKHYGFKLKHSGTLPDNSQKQYALFRKSQPIS